jgi:transcriptional regulator with XRE-family HTH domain
MRLLPKRLIGQTIRGIRNRLGMSQADFASAVGADSGAVVARWERGQAQPDYGTLAKIATMGVVDVLVFHEETSAAEMPQLTPGEATELREILLRMEAMLDDARRIVDRASNRTALDALEAAAGRAPAMATTAEALVLDAEVRLETKPRSRTASAGRRSSSRTTPSSAPKKRSTSSSSSRSGTGGSSRSSSGGIGAGSGNRSSSGGSTAGSSRSSGNGSGSTRSRSGSSRRSTTASSAGTSTEGAGGGSSAT